MLPEAPAALPSRSARPVLVEVLAGPRTFTSASRKLLSGYAFEAIGADRHTEHRGDVFPDPLAVRALIGTAVSAPHQEHQAVGFGP
jgi:hypothetical protein